jgi:hypothetical protein
MMMSSDESKPPAALAALDAHSVGLRICFFWQGDRYAHRIEAVDGLISRTILESYESDPSADWPVSPAFQQVKLSWIHSDKEQGHVAMLAGVSSGSQWSMCVAARDRHTYSETSDYSGEPELFFDVACRADTAPNFLGSTYRAVPGSIAVSDQLKCAFVPADAPGCVLIPKNADLEVEGRRTPSPVLRCKVTDIRFDESPATIRWHYTIRRSSGGPLRFAAKKKRL